MGSKFDKEAYLYSLVTVPLNAKYTDIVDHTISKIEEM